MQRRQIMVALGLSALGWGMAGVGVRVALAEGVRPLTMVAVRSAIVALAVLAILSARRERLPADRQFWRTAAVAGLFNMAVPFALFTTAYQHASAGFVGLLAALMPLTTAIAAHYAVHDEPMTARKLGGMLVALVGVGLLFASGDSGLASGGRPGLAIVLGLGAVVAVGMSSAYAKRHQGSFTPVALTGVQFLLGGLALLPLMLVTEGIPTGISTTGWLVLVTLALFSSLMPFLLFYWVLQRASATMASLSGYVVPLISLIAGVVLLDERVQIGIAAGGALILLGVVLTDMAERRLTTVG
ncbi:MAG: DMT family transporter [Acidimicrobiia bacterium]|nr:DMT family transporter [Acidimicrobiia bacterium]